MVIPVRTSAALRTSEFCDLTRDGVQANIKQFDDRRQPAGDLRRAAVAVTIFNQGGSAALILTMRSGALKNHGGQWALPGGKIDAGETAIQAALRELDEEINLSLDESNVIGMLDDYVTRSGYLITPVVIWADVSSDDLEPNPHEVESIHAFTLDELMHPDSPHMEAIAESDRQVLSMHYGDDRIFAPTGAMLYQFREVAIQARSVRVLHFDQPVFAWR
jgi:8-oxo-dGTP pyrophosphatase MutT (NUDIX family)